MGDKLNLVYINEQVGLIADLNIILLYDWAKYYTNLTGSSRDYLNYTSKFLRPYNILVYG